MPQLSPAARRPLRSTRRPTSRRTRSCTVTVVAAQRYRPGRDTTRPTTWPGTTRSPSRRSLRPPPSESDQDQRGLRRRRQRSARRTRTTSSSSTTRPVAPPASPAGRCSTARQPARTWQVTPLTGSIAAGRQLPRSGGGAARAARRRCRRRTRLGRSRWRGRPARSHSSRARRRSPARARPARRSSTSSATERRTASETAPTAALTNTTSAQRKAGGAQDTDNNAADFDIAAPDPHAGADAAPSVASIDPRCGRDRRRARREHLDHLQRAGERGWQLVHDRVHHRAARTRRPPPAARRRSRSTRRRTSPRTRPARVTVLAASVTDQDATTRPTRWRRTTSSVPDRRPGRVRRPGDEDRRDPGQPARPPRSPATSSVEGVVVGDFEGPTRGGLQGFYLQDRPATATPRRPTASSSSPATRTTASSAGDVVRVTGFARERFDQTTINGSNSDTAAGDEHRRLRRPAASRRPT